MSRDDIDWKSRAEKVEARAKRYAGLLREAREWWVPSISEGDLADRIDAALAGTAGQPEGEKA